MVRVVLAGVGGYGRNYLRELLQRASRNEVRLVGAADPRFPEDPMVDELRAMGVPLCSSLHELLDRVREADLAIISSPIAFHCEQTCLSLSRGAHVLCEKPAAPRIEDVEAMIAARDRFRREVVVGFQWCFSDAVRRLKQDILNGVFGKPVRLKTLVCWPRNETYYARSWAGKMKDASGRWVMDSVAMNAASHYLHLMFYLLGEAPDRSAKPKRVVAETYRANRIETFDTCVLRAWTERETELLFAASHAISDNRGPIIEFEFEHAVIRYDSGGDVRTFQAEFRNGRLVDYGSPDKPANAKLDTAIEAARNPGAFNPCGLEASLSHTLCIQAIHASVPEPAEFPESVRRYDRDRRLVWVEGLSDVLNRCYEEWALPGELGVFWARRGEVIDLPPSRASGECNPK